MGWQFRPKTARRPNRTYLQERGAIKLKGFPRFRVTGRGHEHIYIPRYALAKTAREAAELYLRKPPSPYIKRITVVSEDGIITVFNVEQDLNQIQ